MLAVIPKKARSTIRHWSWSHAFKFIQKLQDILPPKGAFLNMAWEPTICIMFFPNKMHPGSKCPRKTQQPSWHSHKTVQVLCILSGFCTKASSWELLWHILCVSGGRRGSGWVCTKWAGQIRLWQCCQNHFLKELQSVPEPWTKWEDLSQGCEAGEATRRDGGAHLLEGLGRFLGRDVALHRTVG